MTVYFKNIPVGRRFECNGNECIKTSTRTARLIEYNRVFYFRQSELCRLLAAVQEKHV